MRHAGAISAGLTAALLLSAAQTRAEDKEPIAEIEIGGAGEWGLQGSGSSFGPTAAIEYTVLEHWLEIEAGVMPLFGRGQTEWGTELVFKKPWTLTKTVDFMFGIGPEWRHTTGGGATVDSIVGEVVLDFQFWPWPERKIGWFIEPMYGYDFGRGHEQSLGVNVGLLIPIR